MIDDLYGEVFETTGLSGTMWAITGRRLKYAGDLLFEEYAREIATLLYDASAYDTHKVALIGFASLLFGFATENLLKAMLIHKDPNRIQNGRLRKWPSGGHDQIALANLAGLNLTDSEEDYLRRLSSFVRWAGRYPIPFKAENFVLDQLGINEPFVPQPIGRDEKLQFDEFFAKVERIAFDG